MELEELQKSYLSLQDNLKAVTDEKTSLELRNKELDEKVKSLQDTNHNLFLRITTSNSQDKEDKKEITLDDIANVYKKEHKIL